MPDFKPRAIRLLEELRTNKDMVIPLWKSAMIDLTQSGILELLRAWSRALFFKGGTDLNGMALHGAHCAGYAQCLDDLTEFIEFLKDETPRLKAPMDFGAISLALKQGLITEKEADELRKQSGAGTT